MEYLPTSPSLLPDTNQTALSNYYSYYGGNSYPSSQTTGSILSPSMAPLLAYNHVFPYQMDNDEDAAYAAASAVPDGSKVPVTSMRPASLLAPGSPSFSFMEMLNEQGNPRHSLGGLMALEPDMDRFSSLASSGSLYQPPYVAGERTTNRHSPSPPPVHDSASTISSITHSPPFTSQHVPVPGYVKEPMVYPPQPPVVPVVPIGLMRGSNQSIVETMNMLRPPIHTLKSQGENRLSVHPDFRDRKLSMLSSAGSVSDLDYYGSDRSSQYCVTPTEPIDSLIAANKRLTSPRTSNDYPAGQAQLRLSNLSMQSSVDSTFPRNRHTSISYHLAAHECNPTNYQPRGHTLTVYTPYIVQKSYGNEKRFFTPPPMAVLTTPSRDDIEPQCSATFLSDRFNCSYHDETHFIQYLQDQVSGDAIQLPRSSYRWVFGKVHWNAQAQTALSSSSVGPAEKRPKLASSRAQQLQLDMELCLDGVQTFKVPSTPIAIWSKPPKRKSKTSLSQDQAPNVQLSASRGEYALRNGQTVALFNRTKSQALSTRFLALQNRPVQENVTSSDEMNLIAHVSLWEPFQLTRVSLEGRTESTDECILYGDFVQLQSTSWTSPVYQLNPPDSRLMNTPISNMSKVYLFDATSQLVTACTETGHIYQAELSDRWTWTVCLVGISTVSWYPEIQPTRQPLLPTPEPISLPRSIDLSLNSQLILNLDVVHAHTSSHQANQWSIALPMPPVGKPALISCTAVQQNENSGSLAYILSCPPKHSFPLCFRESFAPLGCISANDASHSGILPTPPSLTEHVSDPYASIFSSEATASSVVTDSRHHQQATICPAQLLYQTAGGHSSSALAAHVEPKEMRPFSTSLFETENGLLNRIRVPILLRNLHHGLVILSGYELALEWNGN